MPSGPAISTGWRFRRRRSTFWRSRLSRKRPRAIGRKMSYSISLRSAYPYRDLDRATFESIVKMLSDGIATQRGRSGAFLHRDQVNGRVRGRRGARLAAITSGGAIPENAQVLRGRRAGRQGGRHARRRLRRREPGGRCVPAGHQVPGESGAWSRGACAWRMRMARRRRFRSGMAKRPAARSSCRVRCRTYAGGDRPRSVNARSNS